MLEEGNDKTVVETFIRNIIMKYSNYLLTSNNSAELYKIIYNEIASMPDGFKFLNKLKGTELFNKLPYKDNKEIGSEMGGLGF